MTLSLLRKSRNLLAHTGILARAAIDAAARRRLRGLVAVLRAAAASYRSAGLPALAQAAEEPPREAIEAGTLEAALRQVDAVAALLRAPPFRYCMRRAVLRYHVLRAAGRAPVLVVGAERTAPARGLDGHAWVEVGGQPFREEDDRPQRMTAVYRYPDTQRADLHS